MRHAAYAIRATPRRFTRDEYHRFIEQGWFRGEHIELIHGALIEMSPIGVAHRVAVHKLAKQLTLALIGRAEVFSQQPFTAFDDSEPEPDIVLAAPGDYATAHPDRAFLIIEVADTSLDYDRETKAPLYACSSVDEYWIVNLAQRIVEVYSEPLDGQYAKRVVHKAGDVIASRAFPDVRVEVGSLLP